MKFLILKRGFYAKTGKWRRLGGSYLRLSCKVSKTRSILPLPWGELVKTILSPNSLQALCIWDKLQRATEYSGSINIQGFKYTVFLKDWVHYFHTPFSRLWRKELSMISLLTSSIMAIKHDFLSPNQRCVLPFNCSIKLGTSIGSLSLWRRLHLRFARFT